MVERAGYEDRVQPTRLPQVGDTCRLVQWREIPPGAQPVRILVVGDLVQPGGEAGLALKRRQGLPGPRERLLRQILRRLRAARKAAKQPEDARVVGRDE